MAILLITTSANRQTIAHCCDRAISAGVVRGMSLAHARALLPSDSAHVEEFNPARDEQRLRALASWAIRFTPIVSPDPPDGLLLDGTGCQRVHHGERRLVNAIANSIDWLGFRVRVACASTFACAWAMARYGQTRSPSPSRGANHTNHDHFARERAGVRVHDRIIVDDGDELESLRDLPIPALRLEQDTLDALREVNIDRIGHLTCLPRNDLAKRFGQELLLRLDQALGEALEALEPMRPIELPRVEREFDGPVNQIEGVLLATQELVAQLCDRLRKKESGVRRVDIDFERIDAANLRETVMLSRPSRDAKHLWTLLRPKVEQINIGFGVEKITLTATRIGRLPHAQTERWREGSSGDEAVIECAAGELIDTLASRLGPDRIVRARAVESHIPERAFRHEAVMTEKSVGQYTGVTVQGDRPTGLFEKPELIDVMAVTPEGPPKWLRWRGEEHTIIASSGPERISEEWWKESLAGGALAAAHTRLAARDYFRLQINNGIWLWVFRQLESGRWFVHGEWA